MATQLAGATPTQAQSANSTYLKWARDDQATARTALRTSIQIAERASQLLQAWQNPDDLKRAHKTCEDAYVQLNIARDATQRAAGTLQRAFSMPSPDPLASHLLTVIDKARDSLRSAHSALREAAAFEADRLTHVSNAAQRIQAGIQHTRVAAELAVF